MSREFHQLREFHEGDSLAQVDWKASSRHRQLISREFEEQRNQTVVFLLDTGRRMRALDGRAAAVRPLPERRAAGLLRGAAAGRPGGDAGLRRDRPLAAAGARRGHRCRRCSTTSTTTRRRTAPSDFSEAAERLMQRQRRRSLVVVLTNLRGEDDAELLPALRMLAGAAPGGAGQPARAGGRPVGARAGR